MLVTLSGLDGAGKSTLTEALRHGLEQDGIPAVVFHMNKQVGLYAYVRGVRDALLKLVRSGNAPPRSEEVQASGERSWIAEVRYRIIWNKQLRRLVDLIDLATFMIYRLFVEKIRGRVLIMDRYFYDRITDIADGRRWQYLRWFCRMTPVPDLAVFVEVSPAEAFARKGEYSVESMTRRRAIYREVFSWVPGSVVICNDDRNRAMDELQRLVAERLAHARPRLASER